LTTFGDAGVTAPEEAISFTSRVEVVELRFNFSI
jgi:hypothetical protein